MGHLADLFLQAGSRVEARRRGALAPRRLGGIEPLEPRRFLAADVAGQFAAPPTPEEAGSFFGEVSTAAVDTQFPSPAEADSAFAATANSGQELAASVEPDANSSETPVFMDETGVIHIYATPQADLIVIYEFGALGVTLNGRLHAFELDAVRDVKAHDLGPGDLLSVSDSVRGRLEALAGVATDASGSESDSDALPVMAHFNSPYAAADGEGMIAPGIINYRGYEDGYDLWLFLGKVVDDDPVNGLQVKFRFNGVDVGSTLTQADGTFEWGHFIAPNDYGEMIAQAKGVDGVYSQPGGVYVSNIS